MFLMLEVPVQDSIVFMILCCISFKEKSRLSVGAFISSLTNELTIHHPQKTMG
jgi:hypothetical protein